MLLDKIVIFAPLFKIEIQEKAKNLSVEKLTELTTELNEVIKLQNEEMKEKLDLDPDFMNKLSDKVALERHKEIARISGQMRIDDKHKINKVIEKIKVIK